MCKFPTHQSPQGLTDRASWQLHRQWHTLPRTLHLLYSSLQMGSEPAPAFLQRETFSLFSRTVTYLPFALKTDAISPQAVHCTDSLSKDSPELRQSVPLLIKHSETHETHGELSPTIMWNCWLLTCQSSYLVWFNLMLFEWKKERDNNE